MKSHCRFGLFLVLLFSLTVSLSTNTVNADVDLSVTGLVWDPHDPSSGETLTFTATVSNSGTEDVLDDFYVEFLVSGVSITGGTGVLVTGTVPAGSTLDVQQTWTVSGGEHTIRAEVDVNNVIGEADETNQTYEETIAVDKADYVVTDISWEPAFQYVDPYYSKGMSFTAEIENQGTGSTSNYSYVRFLVNGVIKSSQYMSGLESGASTTVTYAHVVTEAGNFELEVIADFYNKIGESDEDNNSDSATFNTYDILGLPDLMITDISWFPEEFQEGDRVIVQAQVENLGYGGTRTDYDVRFTVDGTDIIGTANVKDDIGLGQMDEAFSNSGFELNTWDNWSLYNNFSLAEKSTHPDSIYATHPDTVSATGMLRSETFTVTDSIIGFYSKSSYYNNYVNLYNEGGSLLKQLRSYNYYSGGWAYYTFNVTDYIGEEVYIIAYCYGGREMSIDNISMGYNPSQRITVALPAITWTVSAGEQTISAEVDVNNVIGEADETNQTYEETISVDRADYVVTDISWEPAFQYVDPYYSKRMSFTAEIENQGTGSTSNYSYVSFLVNGVIKSSQYMIGLESGASTTVTYTHTVTEAGNFELEVIADYYNKIGESDEDNNSDSATFNTYDILGLPDLMITDISWFPEEFQEGDRVIVQAQVENLGYGGTRTDYDVRFTVDGTDIIGTANVKDDIGLGQMDEAFSNSGFELNTWDNWSLYNNFSLAEKSTHPDSIYATHPDTVSATGMLRSETFTVTDSIIGFYSKSSYYNNYVNLYNEGGSLLKQLRSYNYDYFSPYWAYYTFNVTDYIGEEVYIIAYCYGGREMSIDNISMGYNPSQRITVALPAITWTVSAGEQTISAEVDVNNVIGEADETNQIYEETISVDRADYVVTDISWEPAFQYVDPYYSKRMSFTAEIENQGTGSTSNYSYVRFLVNGVIKSSQYMIGLESGASTTVTYTHTVTEAGNFELEVIADFYNKIGESDEDNNSDSATFNTYDILGLPDLMITDISWFPEEFQEGDSVTIQAQVVNNTFGGTRTDYDVRFTIDGTDIIGTANVKDDIGLGQMDEAFSNSGFELNTWDNWSLYNNFSLAEKSTHPDSIYATHPDTVSATGMLRSETFTVTDSIIGFYSKSSYYNNYVNLYNEGGSLLKQLRSYNYDYFSPYWAYYTFNVTDYIGEEVYIIAYCYGGREMSIDNIRMGYNPNPNPSQRITVALPAVTWTASAGEHIIIAEVDVNNVIEESYEYNNTTIKSTKSNDCQIEIFTEFIEICEGEEYKGWYETGEYIRNFDAQDGCDSVVITKLTVNMAHVIIEDIAICQGDSYEGWSSAGVYERTLTSYQGCDSVVSTHLTVHPVYAITEDIEICQGEVYKSWTESGQYIENLTSASGCDSVVTTNLTVNPLYAITEDIEICQGEVYKTWTESGQYIENLTSASGCDSVVTTNLTVNPVYAITEDIEICQGGSYEGWSSAGVYERTLTSYQGCDSVVSTHLTVHPVYAITEDIEICQGEVYKTWTESGQYIENLTSASGCDSVVTTNLTVNPVYAITEDIKICQGEVYKTWTESGQYIENLTSASGCDSVVTTNLTVNPVYAITEDIKICQGEVYKTWTESGQYIENLTSESGCDSVVTTNLTVHPTFQFEENITICEGDSYKGWTKPGQYKENLTSIFGCDSIINTSLTVSYIEKPTLGTRLDTILCEGSYSAYQWYDEYGPVIAANSSVYVVEKSGMYHVEVGNEFGCIITSDGIKMTVTSIDDWKSNLPEFSVFPNPNNGDFQLEVKNNKPGELIIQIYNDVGQILLRKEIQTSDTNIIESFKLDDWTNGLYYVRLINGEYIGVKQFVIY